MEGTGLTGTDALAISNTRNCGYGDGCGFGGSSWMWLIALLFLGGGFGGRGFDGRCATVEDINNTTNFARLESQVRGNENLIQNGFRNVDNAVCQLGYQELQNYSNLGSKIDACCCENRLATQQVKFDMANYAAGINANTTAQTQKILDALAQNKIENLQAQVNQLQMKDALCGVVRYPTQTTYASNCNPFAGFGSGCSGCGY